MFRCGALLQRPEPPPGPRSASARGRRGTGGTGTRHCFQAAERPGWKSPRPACWRSTASWPSQRRCAPEGVNRLGHDDAFARQAPERIMEAHAGEGRHDGRGDGLLIRQRHQGVAGQLLHAAVDAVEDDAQPGIAARQFADQAGKAVLLPDPGAALGADRHHQERERSLPGGGNPGEEGAFAVPPAPIRDARRGFCGGAAVHEDKGCRPLRRPAGCPRRGTVPGMTGRPGSARSRPTPCPRRRCRTAHPTPAPDSRTARGAAASSGTPAGTRRRRRPGRQTGRSRRGRR